MQCQREGGCAAAGEPARVRVRLTDQALVAVTLARRFAGAGDATVAHLLVGLASEPEGAAGRVFARHGAAASRLAARLPAAPPRLPALEVAVGWTARTVEGRPLWTSDLLDASVEVGGGDLVDLLDACGLDAADLASPAPDGLPPWVALEVPGALAETREHDPAYRSATAPAARAVARTRAVGGGAVTLLVALAVEQALAPEAVPIDPDELAVRLRAAGEPRTLALAAPHAGDRGLGAVVEAAERIRPPGRPLAPTDLLRAAALAGGTRASALLAPPPADG